MNETRVASWNELNDCLYQGAWRTELGRFRSNYAFRGMCDASLSLITGLQRMGHRYEEIEGHLLRNFRKYASAHATGADSVWNWLALGQHHGLPTRLLDWTYSPYVALHFATQNFEQVEVDSVVWCVDYARANELLPEVLQDVLRQEGSDVFTVEMLGEVSPTLREFDELGGADFVVYLEPPSLDARIINQFALFSVMSSPTVQLDQWLAGHPELFFRIIIPAEIKWEVRDKLDQANITERVLFPGLDGLSRWLRRYYYSPLPR